MPTPINNLAGKKFGKLIAIEDSGERRFGNAVWECRCGCGKTAFVARNHLMSGSTKSCGCLSKEVSRKRATDFAGQKFGLLTAIEIADKKQGKYLLWKCRCSCGGEILVPSRNLARENTKHCGCLDPQRNMVGRQFERWLVIAEVPERRYGQIQYLCRCICGTERLVRGSELRAGNSKGCGCTGTGKPIISLVGQQFGRLTVIELTDERMNGSPVYLCHCSCGNKKMMSGASLSNRGTESCGCLSSGPTSINWNSSLTDEERAVSRNYDEYRKWRKTVYERDSYTCVSCMNLGGSLVAHHLESYGDNLDLRTEIDNGVTLCKTCHLDFHRLYGRGGNTRAQFNEWRRGKHENNSGSVTL